MADKVQAIDQSSSTSEISLQITDLVRKSDNVVLGFKLNGNNYPLWVRLMRVAIGSMGKSNHITGKPSPPDESDPAYQQWEENDLTVFSWLIQNMENRLIANFAQHQTAKGVWDSLALTYSSGADPLQIYDLEVKANKISQGESTLEDYWNDLQAVWLQIDQRQPNPLGCCEQGIQKYQKLISDRRLFQFLSGLDMKYDNIRRDILKETPTQSAESAFSKVRREAARQQIMSPANNPSDVGQSSQDGIGSGLISRRQPINRPNSSQKPLTPRGNQQNRSGIPSQRKEDRSKRSGYQRNTEAGPVFFSNESVRHVNNLMQENEKRIDVPFYDLESILSATDNFSDANKLGQGGSGPVYKGRFPGGREIAVKRLSSCSGQGIEEFLNEVILIAKLQHRNLVRLLGYCIKGSEKILLYEYMSNRSLDAFIFDQHNRLLLDWKKRFDIILGIARGLLYLHQDSRLRIIHRDLKTSNILLDEDMNPKISDFGLARIVEGEGTEASTNKVVGTYGYMSPEYALDGKFSIKSDVFSFGVVILEIISGRKNSGFYNPKEVLNLLGYAWRLWCDNNALDIIDPTLLESFEKSEVVKCINIGLLCVQEDPNDRPPMSTVVMMLGCETTPLPPPTQPAFVARRRLSTTSSSSSAQPDSISLNELTFSMPEGR